MRRAAPLPVRDGLGPARLRLQGGNVLAEFTRRFGSGAKVLNGEVVDGDGVADLLWQTAAGDVAGWFMNTNGTAREVRGWWNVGAWRLCGAARKR